MTPMQRQNFPFPLLAPLGPPPGPGLSGVPISCPVEIPGLTEESGRYSMWVSSPCCPSRKEQKDTSMERLVSSVGKPVAL